MLRRSLATLGAIGQLPRNHVFHLAMFGRSGWVARGAFLVILIAEVSWLLWMGRGQVAATGTWDWMEYLWMTMVYHVLAGSFLMIGAMWAFLRPFTNAQKEDLWLTRMKPAETVLGVMTPPCIAAALVIFAVPLLLLGFFVLHRVDAILQALLEFLNDEIMDPVGRGGIRIMGGWREYIFTMLIFTFYFVIVLGLWRVLLEGMIRTGTLRIVLALRGIFIALLIGVIASQVEFYSLAFIEAGGPGGRGGLLGQAVMVPTLVAMTSLSILLPAIVGALACLCQYPGRRWFAGVVNSIQDEQDWLAGEESSLAMKDRRWIRIPSPLEGRQLAFLPSAAISGFMGAVVAMILLILVEARIDARHYSAAYVDDLYIIPAILLSRLLGGLLALRRGTFLTWRRHFHIQPGRIAASVRATALVSAISAHVPAFVIGYFLLGNDFDDINEWDELLGLLIMLLMTLLPVWMLHCALLCLWRLPRLRRMASIVMVLSILGLALAMWYPGFPWSRYLTVLLMTVPTALVMFWVSGGSYWFFQQLFDQERSLEPNPAPGL